MSVYQDSDEDAKPWRKSTKKKKSERTPQHNKTNNMNTVATATDTATLGRFGDIDKIR